MYLVLGNALFGQIQFTFLDFHTFVQVLVLQQHPIDVK